METLTKTILWSAEILFLLKIGYKPPDIYSFIYGSALNPDCAVTMHLSNNTGSVVFVFYFAGDTILSKKDFLSYGVIKVYPALISFSATLVY
jgi:hypothetical protein